jgi:hypothetical protein
MTRPRPKDFLVSIPTEWTASQAMAVVEFLHDLEQAIWESYERLIFEHIHPNAIFPLPDPTPDDMDDE